MDVPELPPLDDLVRDLVDFLTSDTLRNFLSSARMIAELARAIYRLVFTAAAAATQVIEAAHLSSTVTLHPATVMTDQVINAVPLSIRIR